MSSIKLKDSNIDNFSEENNQSSVIHLTTPTGIKKKEKFCK
jgi:hypothetical protein